MAPSVPSPSSGQKRPLEEDDADEEEPVEAQVVGASQAAVEAEVVASPPAAKSRRTAKARAKEEEEYEEEQEEGDEEEEEELDMDEDEEDDEDDDEDYSRVAAGGSPIRALNKPGKPPEVGIIKSIYVENFMCHRKLRVKLCRNVNFIHGQNGSGKSAILAAIQICLGAGARRTHRARNLKELVRKDGSANAPTHAKICVTLLNHSDDGYQHDVYGDSITVERTIRLGSGFNGYKLLDCNGKEVSRNKKDLDEMLDVLNIQVENPVAILDQEDAKKFLTGKASDKYAFFMKATELERVDNTFASTVDHVQEMEVSAEKIRDSLQGKHEQVAELKKQWEQHQALDKHQLKVREFNVKYAWAYYNQVDAEYKATCDEMAVFEEKAKKKKEELSQAEEAANAPSDEEEKKKQRSDDLVKEAQEQSHLKRQLEADFKKAQAPLKAVEREISKLSREKKSAARELSQAKKRLQELRDEIAAQSGSAESEQARQTAELKEAEDQLSSLRERVQELKQATSDALRGYEELEPHVHEARGNVEQVNKQVQGVKSRLRELESSSSDSLSILGPRVSKVHKLVQQYTQKRKFRDKVIGPIGSFIKMAAGKESLASITELALGANSLDRFIVFNDHDRATFQKLRQQAGCIQDCGIYQCQKSPRYNVPASPVAGIETVASALNISDDLVFNCLVDNNRIDQRALAKDRESSEKALLEGSHGNLRIRGGTIKDVVFMPKGDMWMVKGGTISVTSNEKKPRKIIGADRSAAIAQCKQELTQLVAELKEHRKEEGRLENEHTEHQKAWNKAKRAMQQNESKISTLETKIEDIKMQMETSANVTIDTTENEEEVEQAEQRIQDLKDQEQQLKEQAEEISPGIDELKRKLEETTARNSTVLKEMEAADADLTQFYETQTQHQSKLEKKRKKLEKLEEAAAGHQARVDSIEADRNNALSKARKLHHRLEAHKKILDDGSETPTESQGDNLSEPTEEELEAIEPEQTKKDPDYYKAKMERAKEKVEKEKKRRQVSNEDPTVAYEKYRRAEKDLSAKVNELDELDAKVKELKVDIHKRKRRWRQFRDTLDKTTGTAFCEFLHTNKFTGDLEFDHDAHTLDLVVQKNSNKVETQTKDVKALSGGERSFTTMCLLLALGETLETPFRVLDEFDVFLDAQTRRLVIESLVHTAKQMGHRQFIFITPQDLSSLKADPKLKILTLHPPERYNGQQTLDFGSQAAD